MKTATGTVTTLLSAAQSGADANLFFAECFTFTLAFGGVYYWTNFDSPVSYGGHTFLADGPLVSGLKFRQTAGLEVDKQQMTIAARSTDLVGGAPALVAIRDGAFDGAEVQRDRVFMTRSASTGLALSVAGGVTLFKGRVSTVDSVGRTRATLTVASDLVILDYDMPRNLFSPTCLHTLYDAGCGLSRAAFTLAGTVAAGSSQSQIVCAGARFYDTQGTIVMTSGLNSGVKVGVRNSFIGVAYQLMYPLPFPPATGDTFNVSLGCGHTMAYCNSVFNNLVNFRGFPFVPPPEMAI